MHYLLMYNVVKDYVEKPGAAAFGAHHARA